ncbi:MAG: flagellin [Rhodospirillaceae bacterium]|nr:flagellin [Rhodospirillaceae bacterium]|tara:strand:- start:1743 stop:2573 length:831 start_codon:yes stop_codon:yes gene_type:complete
MAAEKVNLSEAIRGNLLTLQRSARAIDQTQTRLSTGLAVNSALDDASAFFTAKALNNRASDLQSLKTNTDLAISTVQAALDGIDSITDLVEQAKGLASYAKATGDTNERSTLAVQFNELLSQVDSLANDATFNGINLLQASPDNLDVVFNEDNTSNLTITGLDATTASTGINIAVAANNFGLNANIDTALTAISSALTTLRGNAATLGSNATILKTRLNFTENLTNTLESGAVKLTFADLNEESANLLALQTRQQLGLNSLALAAQSERAILSLFG